MWLQPQQPWWAITVSQRVRIAHPWHLAAFQLQGKSSSRHWVIDRWKGANDTNRLNGGEGIGRGG
jgi:hypothetical protein